MNCKTVGKNIEKLNEQHKGITIAGNMILDVVKSITDYPACGLLTHINSVSYAVGGCAPNTAVNLAKIDGGVPVSVIGKLGYS